MVKRVIETKLIELFEKYPVCTIIGPRQSGKTTLVKSCFKDHAYYNLEEPPQREFAESDPKGFLAQSSGPKIIDEIQRVPELLSYIQVIVDEKGTNSRFVLTGSNQFSIRNQVSQSLAGRTALLTLLPFSIDEVETYNSFSVNELLFIGGYPRIYDEKLDPVQTYGDYFDTYIERDLLQFVSIKNLRQFRIFVRLCAGRIGQLLNFNSLANDVGVSHTTIREWYSILENSFIAYSLQPFFLNIRKRLVKSPKIYFYDTGLATYLIGIEDQKQLTTHPLRGNLFENLVINEILKMRLNSGRRNNLTFYRDSSGNEVDCLYTIAQKIIPIEVKSSETISKNFFSGLNSFSKVAGDDVIENFVVYTGDDFQKRTQGTTLNYKKIVSEISRLEIKVTSE